MKLNFDPLKNLYKNTVSYNSTKLLSALIPKYLYNAIIALNMKNEHRIYLKVMNMFADTLKNLRTSRELHKDEWIEFYELADIIISKGVSKEAMTKYYNFVDNLPDDKLLKDYQKEDLITLYRFVNCYRCFARCLSLGVLLGALVLMRCILKHISIAKLDINRTII